MITGIESYTSNLAALTQSSGEAQSSGETQETSWSDSEQEYTPFGLTGDTIEISEEAYALLQSKMQEYEGMTADDLSDGEKDELKGLLSDALGISEDDVDALAKGMAAGGATAPSVRSMAQEGEDSDGGSEGLNLSMGGEQLQAAPAAGGSAETASSTIDDRIDELEQEIEDLQNEISELQGKANSDPEAKEELKVKQTELTTKQTELAELQSQQEES